MAPIHILATCYCHADKSFDRCQGLSEWVAPDSCNCRLFHNLRVVFCTRIKKVWKLNLCFGKLSFSYWRCSTDCAQLYQGISFFHETPLKNWNRTFAFRNFSSVTSKFPSDLNFSLRVVPEFWESEKNQLCFPCLPCVLWAVRNYISQS